MAKRDRSQTRTKYEKWIKEGRGQGEGADYKPWLTIHDVPSEGVASRGKGWKTGRLHHTLSTLELMYFYLLEWSPIVVDIREQYPLLPPERTSEIADELGVRHPIIPHTDQLAVMTTDFLIEVNLDGEIEFWARQIKPESKLTSPQIDKFRIEQRFYSEIGIHNWGIVTDKDIPKYLAKNIEDLHSYFYIDEFWGMNQGIVYQVADQILDKYVSGNDTFSNTALQLDQAMGFEHGTCLKIAKHMLARRFWLTNMSEPIKYARRIEIRKNPMYLNGHQSELA